MVRLLGILTELREVQFAKEYVPRYVTLLGIVIELRELHLLNAY